MSNKHVTILIVLAGVAAAGCETLDEGTKKGAGIGALTGAAIGGIVGHQDGHGWEGALIGGAAGAVTGGWIGHEMDKRQMAENPEHLTVYKIADMAKNGVPDEVIISEIKRTKSKYELTAEIISFLKDNGVSDAVINAMMKTTA